MRAKIAYVGHQTCEIIIGDLKGHTRLSALHCLSYFDSRRSTGRHAAGSTTRLNALDEYFDQRHDDRSANRYAQADVKDAAKLVPEGIEGRVAYAGSLADVVYQLVGGLRSGMGYVGAATLLDLCRRAKFMRVTTAGREESHPHDVTITHESPNYHRS